MLALLAATPALLMQPLVHIPMRIMASRTDSMQMVGDMPKPWAQPAITATATAIAAAISFAPIDTIVQAKSVGGRVASSSKTSVVRPSTTTMSSSSKTSVKPPTAPVTNIITPPAAPPVTNIYMASPQPMGYGGIGYGGMGYGGYGQPMGGAGMGLLIGAELAEAFLKEQQRQAYIQQQLKVQQQLGTDQAKIQELQRQLAEQNAKVDALAAQKAAAPVSSATPQQAPSEAQLQLQLQVLQQQRELEVMKQGKP
mmetsp:Transcript_26329/g.43721  ORF Transcript_26329/g.43721 Transcript_26329/m.43721 type:complete len:254 (+) Transcript_26329:67-828(+)